MNKFYEYILALVIALDLALIITLTITGIGELIRMILQAVKTP